MNTKFLSHDIRWFLWKLRNPSLSYGHFYLHFIRGRISQGHLHPTLGSVAADSAVHHTTATNRLAFLRDCGLSDTTRIVDYGCGSLRVGQLLIETLAAGCYWGLDISEEFWRPALAALPQELRDAKRPSVATIGPESFACIKQFQPTMIFSGGVMLHIPPSELKQYLGMIVSLAGPQTKIVINYHDGPDGRRLGLMRWVYGQAELARNFHELGCQTEFVDDPVPVKIDDGCTCKAVIATVL